MGSAPHVLSVPSLDAGSIDAAYKHPSSGIGIISGSVPYHCNGCAYVVLGGAAGWRRTGWHTGIAYSVQLVSCGRSEQIEALFEVLQVAPTHV